MSLPVWFRAEAAADLEHHVEYLRQQAGPAAEFARAVQRTVSLLSSQPRMGKPWNPRWIRVFPVHKFTDYLIFYHALEEEVEILRIVHGRQDLRDLLLSLVE